jgi:signal transduction histidine kinase
MQPCGRRGEWDAVLGRLGLFPKYALIIAAVVGLVLIASSAVHGYFAYRESRESIDELQRGLVAAAAADLSQALNERAATLAPTDGLVLSGGSVLTRDPALLADEFESLVQKNFADEIRYVDPGGRERLHVSFVTAAGELPSILTEADTGEDLSGSTGFVGAAASSPFWGPVTQGFPDTNRRFITFGVSDPYVRGAAVIGQVDAVFVLTRVYDFAGTGSESIFLVDESGRLLAHSSATSASGLTDLSHLPQVRKALVNPVEPGDQSDAFAAESVDGEDVLTSYQTIPETGWVVFVEQPASEALEPLEDVILRTGLLLGGSLVFAALAGLVLARTVVRPIHRLQAGAKSIAEGSLDERIEVRSSDELGALASQFNDMAARLKESYADLEGKVDLRTKELAASLDELEVKSVALEAASKHKSEFLASVSHELRTPLNAIIGYSELLQEEARDLEQDAFIPDLDRILLSARHLLGLINDILDLSKIEAGRMTLFVEEFNVQDLVRDVQAVVAPLIEKNKNTLRVHCPASTRSVSADATKVRQSLFNLLSNAAKFTDHGEIRLDVERSAVVEGGPERITFTVADTGIGMTEEQLGRLFEAFSQAEASTSRRYGGTGLGLNLSRSFCRLMGGDITVTSAPGEGSTFVMTIPATQ